jgi:hypothetical protein
VRDVTDAAIARPEGTEEGDRAHNHDEVLGLDREQEIEQDHPVRPQHAVGQQQPVDGARATDGACVHGAGQRVAGHHAQPRADAAQEVVLQEPLGSPGTFEICAKHPQHEHVSQDVAEAAGIVQE